MEKPLEHYYGDIVRYLFLAAGIIMLITLPLFQSLIETPLMVSITGIAVLGIAAGLTNPQQVVSAVVNFVISIVGFITFAYSATTSFQGKIENDKFILTNIILAAIFIFAIYFSMKTMRSRLLNK